MKLRVSKERLLDALQRVQPVIPGKSSLPILSNVLLRAEEGQLWLTTTDLALTVRTRIECEIEEEGAITVSVKRIASIVRELPSGDLSLTVDEAQEVEIRSGGSFVKLYGVSEDEFPPLPEFDGAQAFTVPQAAFLGMLQRVHYAASTDDSRMVLNGVLLSFGEEKLTLVATDGRRLALDEVELEFPEDAGTELVVPTKTVSELLLCLGEEGDVIVRVGESQVAFEFDHMLVISKRAEGNFPNFRQVIPGQSEERVEIERELLFASLRRVSMLQQDLRNDAVRLQFRPDRLVISSSVHEVGQAEETLPIKYAGKELVISFNPGFLMDPLKVLKEDVVVLELTDDLSPGVLKSEGPFVYVIMPMRVS